MVLLLLLAAAEPSPPPLVPMDSSEQPSLEQPAVDTGVTDAPVGPTRTKRLLGTAVGALLGNAIGVGIWFAQIALLAGTCFSCLNSPVLLAVTGIGTGLGIAPLGALIGNRLVGGEAPYWKILLGTAAGAAFGALFISIFEMVGLFRGPSSGATLALGLSLAGVQVVMGQVLATELGVTDPDP